jgi:ABC-type ATPase with predicted acetyltransferase domain
LVIDVLRKDRAVFTRDEVAYLLKKYVDLNEVAPLKYIDYLGRIMSSDKVVYLGVKDLEGRDLYTSRGRYELEESFDSLLRNMKSSHKLGISKTELEKISFLTQFSQKMGLSKKLELTELQKEVALNILNGENISVLEGLPGSGKTNVMREVARHYSSNGYDVIGAAMSASAAIELGGAANIKAMSITKLRYEVEKRNKIISSSKDFNLNLEID